MSERSVSAEQRTAGVADAAARVVAELGRRGGTVAVAESLTGGLLSAALVGIPGASVVLNGAVIAYNTEIKHTVLGVEAELLAERGAVDAEVARQMAQGVCEALSVGGRPADYGLATTGAAGPDAQDGQAPGTVFIALAADGRVIVERLELDGDRSSVRAATVQAALALLLRELARESDSRRPAE